MAAFDGGWLDKTLTAGSAAGLHFLTGNALQTERRVDVLTGRQVIVASNRAERPIQRTKTELTSSLNDDPFLESHEHDTPDERLALRQTTSRPNQPGWLLRVVPNRYPAVIGPHNGRSAAADHAKTTWPVFESVAASGIHDVVIECPDLRTRLTQLSAVEFSRVLLAWQQRLQQISSVAAATGITAVSIFRNEGPGSGASLSHCHSQIIATNFTGMQLEQRSKRAVEFRQATGQCLLQHWLQAELNAEQRVLWQTAGFVAVCPYASRVPWHTRFCPDVSGEPDFSCLKEADLRHLAGIVIDVVRALEQIEPGIAYNLALVLPPLNRSARFPWLLELLPRPHRFAGFELMSDVEILTVTPEKAAQQLREHAVWTPSRNSEPLCPAGYSWQTS